AMSGGIIWLPNNPLQKGAGVEDSFEKSMTYINAAVGDIGPGTSQARKRTYVETGPELFHFLASHGVHLRRCHGYSDYYDELPGGCPESRSMTVDVFDARRLGAWEPKLRRGPVPIPIVGTEMRDLPLAKRTVHSFLVGLRFAARMFWSRITGS